MQIYLARNQVQAGPYTLEQLNRMLASHEVELSDLMWHEGMEQWRAVGEMTGNTHLYQPNGTFIDGEVSGRPLCQPQCKVKTQQAYKLLTKHKLPINRQRSKVQMDA